MVVAPDQVQIEDLGSSFGTYVGGEQVTGLTAFELPPQVKVASATLDLKQVLAAPPRLPPEEALKGSRYGAGNTVTKGGMGIVHEVEDLRLRRVVAMKQMAGSVKESADGLRRFIQEAQILAQLEYSNIMPVHELGLDAHGDVFYTMKFVRGTTLHQVLCGIRDGEADAIGRFPLHHLLTVFQKVCDAIAFAHSKGIIHRDLKPANIMLGEFGEVLVTDWGLAKILKGEDETTTSILDSSDLGGPPVDDPLQTMKGAILGTLQFMAPEQAEGRVDELDARTDIYALGAILYDILALRPPVSGSSASKVLQRIKTGTVDPPTTYNEAPTRRTGFTDLAQPLNLRHCSGGRIPASLSAVAMKALALKPDDRYQTVLELQREIEAHQSGLATMAEQAGVRRQILLLIRRRKREFGLAAAALVIVAGVAVGLFLRILAEKQRAETLLANLHASESTAQAHLTRLQATAPSLHRLALSLIEEKKFPEALDKISYALSLKPDEAEYHCLKGNVLESLQRR